MRHNLRMNAPTTSDNYISELRSDSNASNLVLAVPGIIGATGVAYTDFSANIKGSGTNKVLTQMEMLVLTDSYYGSAMEFDGTGDYFSALIMQTLVLELVILQ